MVAKKVFLVDGSGYIFRAFYAVHTLTTKEGFPTNGLFAFSRMLLKLLSDAAANEVTIVFDAGRENFRHELYPAYKANRPEAPPELVQQLPYFRTICEALGLPVIAVPGFEADDVLATLTERLVTSGCEVVVVTGDKDLLQLVMPGVRVWDTMKDKWYDAPEVLEKWGVGPEKIGDLLALVGDSVDNVPGVPGVGPKTAVQLLKQFGSLDSIIAGTGALRDLAAIRGRQKIADLIEGNSSLLRLSRQLVEIRRDVPITFTLDGESVDLCSAPGDILHRALTRRAIDRAALSRLVEQFEFQSLFKELPTEDLRIATAELHPHRECYQTVLAKDFDRFAEQLLEQAEFAFDIETTSLLPREAHLVGASVCWGEDAAFYIPIGHVLKPDADGGTLSASAPLSIVPSTRQGTLQLGDSAPVLESPKEYPIIEGQVPLETFLALMTKIFQDRSKRIIGQNLKYDLSVLLNYGVRLKHASAITHLSAGENPPPRARIFDTMVAAYLINPDRGGKSLDALAQEYLNEGVLEFTDVVGDALDFRRVPIDTATCYAAQDAHIAWRLAAKLRSALESLGLQRVAEEIDFPLVAVLADMEWQGVQIEVPFLMALSEEFGSRIAAVASEIYEAAGVHFNLNSPKQMAEVLFDRLQLSTKGLKRTKSGISTDSSVLEKLQDQHPLPALVLHYRLLHKLKSTYVDSLPHQVSPITGRLHTKLNQTVTGTGRLSSSEPNLQNIPIQSMEGRRIRSAFTAPPGKLLISADYSQIELRLLAHLSEDEELIGAFLRDEDIHVRTARQIFGISAEEELPPDARRAGKTINFGVIYGMSGMRLGRELGLSISMGNDYIQRYFAQFPKVKQFFDRLEQEALEVGEVRTMYGRRRLLAALDTSGRDRNFAARVAVNAPIQGSAADLIKLAMVRLRERIEGEALPLVMVLQIHDELLFECAEEFVPTAMAIVKEEMEHVCELKVPLRVDIRSGKTWGAP